MQYLKTYRDLQVKHYGWLFTITAIIQILMYATVAIVAMMILLAIILLFF